MHVLKIVKCAPLPALSLFVSSCLFSKYVDCPAKFHYENNKSFCALKSIRECFANITLLNKGLRFYLLPQVHCGTIFSEADIRKAIEAANKQIEQNQFTPETEELLRSALKSAIALQNRKEVVNVQNVLALFYALKDDPDKAEIMYKFVIQNLKLMHSCPTDLNVIEASVQLANINGMNNNHASASQGFEWCILTLRRLVETCCPCPSCTSKTCGLGKEDVQRKTHNMLSNALRLYGKYLHRNGKHPQAIIATMEALHFANLANGCGDLSVMVLHNDIAAMKCDLGMHKEALGDAWKALDIAKKHNSVSKADKAVFYCNLGSIYQTLREYQNATHAYEKAWEEVSRSRDQRLKTSIASMMAKFYYDKNERRWWNLW